MRKVGIVILLLGIAGIAYPYVSNSFLYSSTAGLYLDDYDWMVTDPGYIPYIEGNRLYTNLSNFINQGENVFGELGMGYYLLGLKYSNLGVVIDKHFFKVPDSTGIGDFLGHGEEIDTIYTRDPNTGEVISTSIRENSRDAWHENRAIDFMLGWGIPLSEATSIGFSYAFRDSMENVVSPDDNFATTTNDLAGTFTSISGNGTEKSSFNNHRFLFSYWSKGEDWDLNLKLGGILRMGDFLKTDVESASKYESAGSLDSTSNSKILHTSPYLGFGIPLDFLAIRHLWETNELWFNIGGRYYQRSLKGDAGGNEIIADTIPATPVYTTSSSYDTLKGSYSEIFGHLFTKGVFQLSEKASLGIGFRFGIGMSTDSSKTETSDHYASGDTTQDSTYSNWSKIAETQLSFSFPVGIEFKVIGPLSFRLGAIYSHNLVNTTREEGSLGPEFVITTADGTPDTTYKSTSPSFSKETIKETIDNTIYTYGLGYGVTDNLQIDLMGFSDLLDLSRWKLSLTLKF